VHELSISSAIVNTVVKHARGRQVSVVDLRIGALRQVVPDSLVFYFGIVARDTICEEAELRLDLIPAKLRCPSCELEWDPAPEPALDIVVPNFRCPTCGTAESQTLAGDELEVESIEVEDAPSGILSG
jgi:hydrogenase nickel incorporation protein HypA/HybF